LKGTLSLALWLLLLKFMTSALTFFFFEVMNLDVESTSAEVIAWLHSTQELAQYKDVFEENEIDGNTLNLLTRDLGKEMGIKKIKHWIQIKNAIAKNLNENEFVVGDEVLIGSGPNQGQYGIIQAGESGKAKKNNLGYYSVDIEDNGSIKGCWIKVDQMYKSNRTRLTNTMFKVQDHVEVLLRSGCWLSAHITEVNFEASFYRCAYYSECFEIIPFSDIPHKLRPYQSLEEKKAHLAKKIIRLDEEHSLLKTKMEAYVSQKDFVNSAKIQSKLKRKKEQLNHIREELKI